MEVNLIVDDDPNGWPDHDWLDLFRSYRDFPADLEEPRFEGGKLQLQVREQGDDLERLWSATKERIAASNRAYAERRIPTREAQKLAEESEAAATQERSAAVQDRLDKLD